MAMNNSPTFVVTGRVRLSYVHLFQPYTSISGGEPKFSATILLPKNDIATKQRIDAAIEAAKQAGAAKTWNGIVPPIVATPIHDGDGVRPSDGMPFGQECKGHWVFTASSKQAPEVVDASMNPIINPMAVYSGLYARVSINFFPFFNSGKKGIGCGLGNVMKLEDGEPLGGRTCAADDFAVGAPQQPAAYPQPPQTPYQQPYQAPFPAQAPGYQPQYPQAPQVLPQSPAYQAPFPAQAPGYQPQYPQAPQVLPQSPAYQPTAVDPITGLPVMPGNVMGL